MPDVNNIPEHIGMFPEGSYPVFITAENKLVAYVGGRLIVAHIDGGGGVHDDILHIDGEVS